MNCAGQSHRWLVAAILLGHTCWLAWSAAWQSPTFNEPAHLVSGLAHWTSGRFELYRTNPPLTRLIAAIPVLIRGSETDWSGFSDSPGARSEFRLGARYIEANGATSQDLFTLARWACIPFSLLGACTCYRWAKELYGSRVALCSLALWCSEPNILANAQLITPDIAATSGALFAAYTFWTWLRQQSWWTAMCASIGLGFALLTKFTLLILVILWPVLWLCWACTTAWRRNPVRWTKAVCQLVLMECLALIVINACYAFDDTFARLDSYRFVSASLNGGDRSGTAGNRFSDTCIGKLRVPFPRQYLLGIDAQKRDFEFFPYDSYLHGEWKSGGWWYYYLYAACVKIPSGLLLMFVTSVVCLLCGIVRLPRERWWMDEVILFIPPVVIFVLVSTQTTFNLHFRYVLPAMGAAIVAAPIAMTVKSKAIQVWIALCLVWSISSSVAIAPYSLSYFNELAGGADGGHRHLLHSSIDWGQDLLHLKRWCSEHPDATPMFVCYYGMYNPIALGLNAEESPHGPDWAGKLPERKFQPGWYAISVNYLYGCEWRLMNREVFTPFQDLVPVAQCGYSIFIYRVDDTQAQWLQSEWERGLLERREFVR